MADQHTLPLPTERGEREGYVLTRSAPALPAVEVEQGGIATLEVVVRWGANILQVTHLAVPSTFKVGESADCNFTLPRQKLGCDSVELVRVLGGVLSLHLPAGARGHLQLPGEPGSALQGSCDIAARLGVSAELQLADFVFAIAIVPLGKRNGGGVGAIWDAPMATYFAGSFFAHAALVAALAAFIPPLGLTDAEGSERDRIYAMQQYLDAAAERETKQLSEAGMGATRFSEAASRAPAAAEAGQTGKVSAPSPRRKYATQGPHERPDRLVSRIAALQEARSFGLVGLLNAGMAGEANGPSSLFAGERSLGSDPSTDAGNLWGDELGEAFGHGGLTVSGVGYGGGADRSGVGLGVGDIGGLGRASHTLDGGTGDGVGRLPGSYAPKQPRGVRLGDTLVSGRLPKEVIQRVVRQNHGRFRFCYEQGLTRNPNLQGRIEVRFVIGRDGAVQNVTSGSGSDVPDASVKSCLLAAFYNLSFPAPEGGIVTVAYPLVLAPG